MKESELIACAVAGGVGGLAAILVAARANAVSDALGLVDVPDEARKTHKRPVPLVGGVAVLAALLAGAGLWLLLVGEVVVAAAAAALPVAVSFTVGMLDDHDQMRPGWRLVGIAAAALVAVLLAPSLTVQALDLPAFGVTLGLGLLAVPFTVLAYMILQNALNMADGIDGLSTGLLLVWIALMTPWTVAWAPHLLPAVVLTVTALAVVFAFNWFGKLFLGDAGTYGLGMAVGLLAVHLHAVAGGALPSALVGLWFGLPVLDLLRQFAQRLAAGQHPFEADRNHFHHWLEAAHGKRRAVLIYLTLVAVPGTAATLAPGLVWVVIGVTVVAYLAMLRRAGWTLSLQRA